MRNRIIDIASSAIVIFILCISTQSYAQVMSDYTAYPPFVTNAVQPNILLVLDHSGSMQFPAYIGCDFSSYDNKRAECGTSNSIDDPEYAYQRFDASGDDFLYYGYFVTDKYYKHTGTKFEQDATCTTYTKGDAEYLIGDAASGCMSGNLLNWATMSRIDLMRKVLIGGKSLSTQANAHTLRPEGGWRTYSDHTLGCTFNISGGSYPNLDHDIAISDYNCGTLEVKSTGSYIFGTSDSFRYIYQSVSGDLDAKLLVTRPPSETGETYAKAGLMVREDTTAGSAHFKVMATNSAGLQISYRGTAGGDTTLLGAYVPISYPVWVRVIRTASTNTFTAYYSSDGTTWTTHGSANVVMNASVLLGMASASYSTTTYGYSYYDDFICDICTDDDFNDGTFDTATWTSIDIATTLAGSDTEACSGGCAVGTLASGSMKVDVPDHEKRGIIQNLSDQDNDTQWDDNSPRFGVMIYAGDSREGEMKVGIDGSNMSSFLTSLQGESPYSGTPTGEALREAYDYFTQINNYSYEANNSFIGGQGSTKDPMYDSGTSTDCRKNFVLLISDGEWNGSVDPVIPARENYVNDCRSDLDGEQNIATYAVYTFGNDDRGRQSLQQVAMFGNFDDYDDDDWPYNRSAYPADSRTEVLPASPCDPASTMDDECREWDNDGPAGVADGIPDNYYEASDGNVLEAKLIEAISDILKRASSGTAVSVLATSGEGEGAIYQAYFFPQKLENLEERKWLGYIKALFVDSEGNMKEDTNGNDRMDATDLIIQMSYSDTEGTEVYKCTDVNGDGKTISCPTTPENLESIGAIWKGGELLWARDPDTRIIKTTTDGSSVIDFSVANAATLEPFLRASDTTEAENIIKWIRGSDLTGVADTGHASGYRKRDITINNVSNVWKLGDVVYSTPTVVGPPMENYDDLYLDASYREFEKKHDNRRHNVYVGANDGMLHAFNGGCFDKVNTEYFSDVSGSSCVNSGTYTLGQELWAFIPQAILPHLMWNTLPEYTHVYSVDLKPKVTDVKVFTSDTTHHIQGWGTILIGGYRYGGKDITWTSGGTSYTRTPEFYALDITDPINPQLLWTFSHSDLGLTMSYPSVAKVGDTWYAIFGAGPTDFDSSSNLTSFQDGNIFVLKINGGENGDEPGYVTTWTKDLNYWIIPTGNTTSLMANSITVDYDRIDYAVDVIYIGENYKTGSTWNSKMRRLTTANGTVTNPNSWAFSTLLDVSGLSGSSDISQKITAAPSATSDDKGNLWLFFGTGQFYGLDDKNNTDTGAFYGVKDFCWNGGCNTDSSSLLDVSGASVDINGNVSGVNTSACAAASTTSTWTTLVAAANACDGWAMYFSTLGESSDFLNQTLNHAGERVFTKPIALGELVAWGSYIPGTSVCSFLGESNAYAVNYKTGTAYTSYLFDTQKEQTNPADEVARVANLGIGMPSSPSAHIQEDGTIKIYFQNSTGAVSTVGLNTPYKLKSAPLGWKAEQIP